MKRVVGYIATAVIAVLLSFGMLLMGFKLGTDFEAKEIDKENNKVQNNDLIAIVNLDEGVLENEVKRFYSTELITIPEAGYEKCSLTEARDGIGNGKYGAYVIIPATFSESVRSVDKELLKVELKYDLNPYLTEETQQKLLNNIFEFQNSISNSISYAYVYSILDEYHDIQDSSVQILANDITDLDNILAIDPESIAQDVEYSQIQKNTYEIKDVDFSGSQSTIQSNYDEINQYYKEGSENAKNALKNVINTNDTSVGNKISELQAIETADFMKNDDGSYVYDAGIAKLQDEMNLNMSAEDRINGMRDDIKADAILREAIIQEYVDNQLYIIQENNKQQMELLIAQIEAEYAQKKDAYLADPFSNPMPSNIVTSEIKNMYGIKSAERGLVASPSGDKVRININDATIQPSDIGNLSDDKRAAIMLNVNPFDGFQRHNIAFSNELENTIAVVFADSDALKNIINQDIISPSVSRLESHIEDYSNKCDEVTGALADYKKALSGIDMYSYISTDKIASDTSTIKNTISSMNSDMKTQISEYESYVSETDRVANENVNNLLGDIKDANSATKENLANSIAQLQESREEINQTNVELLEDFTNHLSYTRMGDLANTNVYDFIVSPVNIDQTDSGLVIEQYKRKDYSNIVIIMMAISLGLCAIIFGAKVYVNIESQGKKTK